MSLQVAIETDLSKILYSSNKNEGTALKKIFSFENSAGENMVIMNLKHCASTPFTP